MLTIAERMVTLTEQEKVFRQSIHWRRRRRKTRKGMPVDEAHRKIRALARWEFQIDDMVKKSTGLCCPQCVFGASYTEAVCKAALIRRELGLWDRW